MNFKRLRIGILLTCAGLLAFYWFVMVSNVTAETKLRRMLEWPKTDFSKTIVALREIESSGPPKMASRPSTSLSLSPFNKRKIGSI